jgi:transposase
MASASDMVWGMATRYKATLTQAGREELTGMTRRGKSTAKKFVHARALLLCDAGDFGDPWKVAEVADALGMSTRTIEHIKQRFVEEGIESALERKRHKKPRAVVFDGAFNARLTKLACSKAPEGRARWTLRLLAEKIVELKIAESVSAMTVQRALKKMNFALT